jgi:hypothetical protein
MATTQNTYTGDGSTTNYSFTFEYLDQSDVKAELDGTATTAFTFVNATTLGFNTAPGNGVAIRIFRDTSTETLKATFFPGSAIKAEDLNTNFTQNNFASQESKADSSQAPQALANSVTAVNTANSAASDASVALAAVNNVVAAQAVADVAALAALNTSGLSAQDQVEVFNSTNIQTYNTTYPSAPQITGAPVGFVGATDVTVKLAWTGSAWTWNSYFATDPDNRYQPLDAGLTYLDGLNFTDETTFKQSLDLEIGVDLQAYDANTAKLDSPQTFTGSVTASSFFGDGSDLSNIEFGTTNFVASGAIGNGDAVVINTDGTVSVISSTGSISSIGSETVVDSSSTGDVDYPAAVYDSTNNKVVVAYERGTVGYAVVGTVSGTSISFGSPVTFFSNAASHISAAFANGKVVIAWYYSTTGYAVVGTVSGTSISFGNQETFDAGSISYVNTIYDSTNDKVVIAYRNTTDANDPGYGIVGTISGTSISFGSPVNFVDNPNYISATFANGKVVISYRKDAEGYGIVGTVSGTSISFGSATVFYNQQFNETVSTYDSINDKVIIAYNDVILGVGSAVVGTVSGTSISFGNPVQFHNGVVDGLSITYAKGEVIIVYSSENFAPDVCQTIIGEVSQSDNSINFGTPITLKTQDMNFSAVTYDSTNDKVVIFKNASSINLSAFVYQQDAVVSNLTSDNFIGIAAEAISNGATGKINIIGGVNPSQTGLTVAKKYYVHRNGTLNTSVETVGPGTVPPPKLIAGTAISSTKLIVKN